MTTFFSPQLILQKTNGYFHSKLSFSEVPEGIQHFSGGGGGGGGGGSNILQGGRGSNCLSPIETNMACDFPGGGGVRTPIPPSGSAHGKN